jgi:hypothetical protein
VNPGRFASVHGYDSFLTSPAAFPSQFAVSSTDVSAYVKSMFSFGGLARDEMLRPSAESDGSSERNDHQAKSPTPIITPGKRPG